MPTDGVAVNGDIAVLLRPGVAIAARVGLAGVSKRLSMGIWGNNSLVLLETVYKTMIYIT